ncbi:MAG: glycosyltransferase family 2 protein [Bacteroidetes bacterium]|nr:glycosyltransferase family 2 protein [Bacteroidota bacterium]MBU1580326.1 glycosyltransferase family 2 protein [Bacteroidota bacterium]MBU2465583.1 glycosyltransferase family 2 protein [Bacteroidota bacterium]MBU2556509.1 glycosyltransferase family 2 protein [Bacteroidota bacterium]
MATTNNVHSNLPLVSIITVNYNQSGVTLEFLASLQACTYPNYEIFVVDNASPNDTPDIIKESYPAVNLIKTSVNLGFAGGNNVAVEQAKGKYLLFINNDTEVEPSFLEPMVALLESNPEIGMVSPKIHYFHTPNTFQYAGFSPIHPISVRNYAIGFGEQDVGQYNHTVPTGSIFGAAMLIPKKVIDEVGMMSEVFFLYYEEHDWAARIEKAGYKIYFDGRSLVKHKESISTVKNSPFQLFYLNRGRILYARRNNKGIVKLLSILFLYGISMPKIMFQFLLKNRPDLAGAVLKSMWWNVTHRSEINNNKK